MSDKPATLIRICPFTKTVEAVEWDGVGRELNTLIAPPGRQGSGMFTYARASGGIDLIVDDEGLYMGWPYFEFAGYGQALAGRGLVCSTDGEGNTIAPTLSVESVRAMVSWNADAVRPRFEIFTGYAAVEKMFGTQTAEFFTAADIERELRP